VMLKSELSRLRRVGGEGATRGAAEAKVAIPRATRRLGSIV